MTLQNPGMITAATAEPLAKITFVPKETVPLPLEVPLYKHFESFWDPEIAASVLKRHAAK
jgi:hypothetical protein